MKLRQIISIITDNFLVIGLFIFLIGLFSYFTGKSIQTVGSLPVKTSLTERDIAISEAVKNGQKEYTFTTKFIPGIGIITDPQAYKDEWQKKAEEDLNKKTQ